MIHKTSTLIQQKISELESSTTEDELEKEELIQGWNTLLQELRKTNQASQKLKKIGDELVALEDNYNSKRESLDELEDKLVKSIDDKKDQIDAARESLEELRSIESHLILLRHPAPTLKNFSADLSRIIPAAMSGVTLFQRLMGSSSEEEEGSLEDQPSIAAALKDFITKAGQVAISPAHTVRQLHAVRRFLVGTGSHNRVGRRDRLIKDNILQLYSSFTGWLFEQELPTLSQREGEEGSWHWLANNWTSQLMEQGPKALSEILPKLVSITPLTEAFLPEADDSIDDFDESSADMLSALESPTYLTTPSKIALGSESPENLPFLGDLLNSLSEEEAVEEGAASPSSQAIKSRILTLESICESQPQQAEKIHLPIQALLLEKGALTGNLSPYLSSHMERPHHKKLQDFIEKLKSSESKKDTFLKALKDAHSDEMELNSLLSRQKDPCARYLLQLHGDLEKLGCQYDSDSALEFSTLENTLIEKTSEALKEDQGTTIGALLADILPEGESAYSKELEKGFNKLSALQKANLTLCREDLKPAQKALKQEIQEAKEEENRYKQELLEAAQTLPLGDLSFKGIQLDWQKGYLSDEKLLSKIQLLAAHQTFAHSEEPAVKKFNTLVYHLTEIQIRQQQRAVITQELSALHQIDKALSSHSLSSEQRAGHEKEWSQRSSLIQEACGHINRNLVETLQSIDTSNAGTKIPLLPHIQRIQYAQLQTGFCYRQEQLEVLAQILKNPSCLEEMRMGLGKTVMICPTAVAILASLGKLGVCLVPNRLFKLNFSDMDPSTKHLFDMAATPFEFNRNTLSFQDSQADFYKCAHIYEGLIQAKANRGYLISTIESLASLENTINELDGKRADLKTRLSPSQEEKTQLANLKSSLLYLSKIWKLFHDANTSMIIDEVDDVTMSTHEVSTEVSTTRIDPEIHGVCSQVMEIIFSCEGESIREVKESIIANSTAALPSATIKESSREILTQWLKQENTQKSVCTHLALLGYLSKEENIQVTNQEVSEIKEALEKAPIGKIIASLPSEQQELAWKKAVQWKKLDENARNGLIQKKQEELSKDSSETREHLIQWIQGDAQLSKEQLAALQPCLALGTLKSLFAEKGGVFATALGNQIGVTTAPHPDRPYEAVPASQGVVSRQKKYSNPIMQSMMSFMVGVRKESVTKNGFHARFAAKVLERGTSTQEGQESPAWQVQLAGELGEGTSAYNALQGDSREQALARIQFISHAFESGEIKTTEKLYRTPVQKALAGCPNVVGLTGTGSRIPEPLTDVSRFLENGRKVTAECVLRIEQSEPPQGKTPLIYPNGGAEAGSDPQLQWLEEKLTETREGKYTYHAFINQAGILEGQSDKEALFQELVQKHQRPIAYIHPVTRKRMVCVPRGNQTRTIELGATQLKDHLSGSELEKTCYFFNPADTRGVDWPTLRKQRQKCAILMLAPNAQAEDRDQAAYRMRLLGKGHFIQMAISQKHKDLLAPGIEEKVTSTMIHRHIHENSLKGEKTANLLARQQQVEAPLHFANQSVRSSLKQLAQDPNFQDQESADTVHQAFFKASQHLTALTIDQKNMLAAAIQQGESIVVNEQLKLMVQAQERIIKMLLDTVNEAIKTTIQDRADSASIQEKLEAAAAQPLKDAEAKLQTLKTLFEGEEWEGIAPTLPETVPSVQSSDSVAESLAQTEVEVESESVTQAQVQTEVKVIAHTEATTLTDFPNVTLEKGEDIAWNQFGIEDLIAYNEANLQNPDRLSELGFEVAIGNRFFIHKDLARSYRSRRKILDATSPQGSTGHLPPSTTITVENKKTGFVLFVVVPPALALRLDQRSRQKVKRNPAEDNFFVSPDTEVSDNKTPLRPQAFPGGRAPLFTATSTKAWSDPEGKPLQRNLCLQGTSPDVIAPRKASDPFSPSEEYTVSAHTFVRGPDQLSFKLIPVSSAVEESLSAHNVHKRLEGLLGYATNEKEIKYIKERYLQDFEQDWLKLVYNTA